MSDNRIKVNLTAAILTVRRAITAITGGELGKAESLLIDADDMVFDALSWMGDEGSMARSSESPLVHIMRGLVDDCEPEFSICKACGCKANMHAVVVQCAECRSIWTHQGDDLWTRTEPDDGDEDKFGPVLLDEDPILIGVGVDK